MARNLDSFLPKSDAAPNDAGIPVLWFDADDRGNQILNSNNELLGGFTSDPFRNRFGQIDPANATSPQIVSQGSRRSVLGTPADGVLVPGAIIPKNEVTLFLVYYGNDDGMLANDGGDIVINDSAIVVSGVSESTAGVDRLDDDDGHILLVKWDAVSGECFVKFDDQDGFVSASTSTAEITAGISGNSWHVANDDSGTAGTTGRVGEAIVYANTINDLHINRLGRYLCAKWNLLWSDV